MSEATLARLLVFRVGNLVCAAEVDQVREILPRLPTTRIPGAPPVVAGLVNVRGTLVTVVAGWRALGQAAPAPLAPPAPDSPGQPDGEGQGSTILLEMAVGGAPGAGNEQSRKLVGFTVDEVLDMLAVRDTTLENSAGLAGIDPMLVQAVGRRRGQIFVVLNLAALLGPILSTQGREQ